MTKIILQKTLFIFFTFIFLGMIQSCNIGGHNIFRKANIYDYQIFSQADIRHKNEDAFRFYFSPHDIHSQLNKWRIPLDKKKHKTFEDFCESTQTVSFIVIRNDSILYENYFNGVNRDSMIGVFSISKSIVNLMAGIAYDDGVIKNLNEPAYKYIPEYKKDERKNITLYQLMNMTSGFNCNDYKSFGKIIRLYYEDNLEDYIKRMNLKFKPGAEFIYKSFDTQVLGFCLEKAYNKKLYEVLEDRLWKPLDMEYDATWNLDRYLGNEKMFGGLNMRCIDLAKIGRLMLNKGKWNDKQIISQKWVEESFKRKKEYGRSAKYSLGWWQTTRRIASEAEKSNDLLAAGMRGQYLYLYPDKNIIIIRQGTDRGGLDWDYEFHKLCESL